MNELPYFPRIIALSGGSGSGKTTTANLLRTRISNLRVVILQEDDYYCDNGATPGFDASVFNFDDVAARDHALLALHLQQLKCGHAIERPIYDFVTHRRRRDSLPVQPADIILVEGTHVLHTAALRALYDFSLYLDVPDDVRLARRVMRDVIERGRSVESVIAQYFGTVRPMHACFTEPTKSYASRIVTFSPPFTIENGQCGELIQIVEDLEKEIAGNAG